jgi:predicted GIY-YIG superfamily endonuclease
MLLDDGSIKTEISTFVDRDQGVRVGLFSHDTIKNKIEKLAENQKYIYVGFTDDPVERFSQHQKTYIGSESWSQMVVLFESGDLHDTYVGETRIIKSTMKKFGKEKCLNESMKYELGASQYYSVYVLVGKSGV